MQRDKILNNPLAWVVGGALITTWLFGVFHSYRGHGLTQAAAALLLPPYGLYMAVEESVAHSKGGEPAFSLPVGELIEQNAAACRESDNFRDQSGLSVEQFAVFCSCIWRFVFENYPSGENEYVAKFGKNSPELESVKSSAIRSCFAAARNDDRSAGNQ